MSIENRSDDLDKRLEALPNVARFTNRLIGFQVAIMTLIIIAFFTIHFYESNKLEHEINDVVSAQIPALKSQVMQRDKTISDQQYELNEAIAAIKKLAIQVKMLGGDPGQITINPPPNK